MHKCPFCQYDNEDGALFCEQCKSDLGAGQAVAVAEAVPEPAEAPDEVPVADEVDGNAPAPVAEEVPMAAPVEAAPPGGNGMEQPPEAPAATPEAKPVLESPPTIEPLPPIPEAAPLPTGTQPRLVVLRGLKLNVEYPLYEGLNFIGRADEKPVDVDLEDQEPPDRVWSSRQHAVINFEEGKLAIEDLNSSNGTFVNRTRVYPNQKRPLNLGDVIQIGTVQLKVKA
jgi:FHA domain